MPRVISILETDLNKDCPHRETQLALEIRPENTIFRTHGHDIFNI